MIFCTYCGKSFTRKEHLERHIPSRTLLPELPQTMITNKILPRHKRETTSLYFMPTIISEKACIKFRPDLVQFSIDYSAEIFSSAITLHTTKSRSPYPPSQERYLQLPDKRQLLASTVQARKPVAIKECLVRDVLKRIYHAKLALLDAQQKLPIDPQARPVYIHSQLLNTTLRLISIMATT